MVNLNRKKGQSEHRNKLRDTQNNHQLKRTNRNKPDYASK